MANQKVTDFVVANGARLYYERQGTGRSLLFIAGSTGDAGNFTRAADLLADEFRVVTYDRRGNSRSERPAGWTTTSVPEQADDAAGIIQALGLEPAVVFGASAGGPIALDLMIRHPHLLRAGILQDPAIFSVLPDPAAALAPRRALVQESLETRGPRGTIAALMRYLNDDGVLAAIPSDILERMLDNADTILNIENPGLAGWQPKARDLAALEVPVVLMIAGDTLPVYRQVTDWLARRLEVEPITVPGQHAFYYYRPQALADALRPILRRASGGSSETPPTISVSRRTEVPTASSGPGSVRRFWIGVISRSHVEVGVRGGFVQLGHGKKTPLQRLRPGDGLIMYSPRTSYPDGEALQSFTAIGVVTSGQIHQVEMAPGFRPYRLDVEFLRCHEAPIRPLIDKLSFIKSKTHWGATFRFGQLEIAAGDFNLIARAMGCRPFDEDAVASPRAGRAAPRR